MKPGQLLIRLALANALCLNVGLAEASTGQGLFATHCEACHGENGAGGVGVPLSLPSFLDGVDDDYLRKTIQLGRPGRVMPSFAQLNDHEIGALVATIRSWGSHPARTFPEAPVNGNVSSGASLFASHCQSCHGVNGQGGHGTGVTFSRARNAPIVAPSISNPGFLKSASDMMIRYILVHGREGTPMVSASELGLGSTDIDDLVAYIRSLARISRVSLHERQPPILSYQSSYTLEETIALIKQAILGQNFRIIRTQYLEQGLVEEGQENTKQVMIYFCNFKFLFDSLAVDPRLGMFLPCRITVVETETGVSVMAINPKAVSALFNNRELDQACNKMHDIYDNLLEDATL